MTQNNLCKMNRLIYQLPQFFTHYLILIITGETIKTVTCSGTDDVNKAVSSAHAAQAGWAAMSGFERGQILKKAADIVRVIKNVFFLIR